MLTIVVNIKYVLGVFCLLMFGCVMGMIVTDKTDCTRNFLHYVLYIATFILIFGTAVIISLFVVVS